MGCTCQKNNTIINESREKNIEINSRKLSLNQINLSRKEEEEILIYSEMLVNENKGDILKYYIPLETIGEGSFGKVFRVKQRSTGRTFAMKIVNKKNNINNNKNFLNEIYILRKLDHPNILKIYEYFSNEQFWYFIMEYVSGGELY